MPAKPKENKDVQASVDMSTMKATFVVPISGEEKVSGTGKSIMHYHSGMFFTKIPGTNLMYKLVIIRDIKSNTIVETEEDVARAQKSSKG